METTLAPLRGLPPDPAIEDVVVAVRGFADLLAMFPEIEGVVLRAHAIVILKERGFRGSVTKLVDSAVKDARRQRGGAGLEGHDNLAGSAVLFREDDPWAEPVDGAALLDELVATIRGHAFMSADDATAVALWIVHTHTLEAARCTPRLAFLSPVKRCGKTTALRLLRALVARALPATLPSAAVLFRTIEAHRPTVLIDEADALSRENEDLRAVLNDGHMHDGVVLRCVGDEHEPRAFHAFAPVAIGAIGTLWDTLLDRSIVISMRRIARGEVVRKLRRRDLEALSPLRRRCARWAADNGGPLKDAEPTTPDALHDRAADNWEPLLAIADATGGDWPRRARAAAIALSGGAAGDRDSEAPGVQLLADVRDLLDGLLRGHERVFVRRLAAALCRIEDRPWATIQHGKPLDANGLGRRLRPFGIRTVSIRISGEVGKGYLRTAFADAFARYLPSASVTSVTSAESQANAVGSSGLRANPVTGAPPWQTQSPSAHVTDVTAGPAEPTDYAFEERAAIMEHDGGLPRSVAEYVARRDASRA